MAPGWQKDLFGQNWRLGAHTCRPHTPTWSGRRLRVFFIISMYRRLNVSIKSLNVLIKSQTMIGLIYIYGTIAAVAGAIAVWFHTPWGKSF